MVDILTELQRGNADDARVRVYSRALRCGGYSLSKRLVLCTRIQIGVQSVALTHVSVMKFTTNYYYTS